LLIVDWPRSDIQWAEPRDVSVEEFLDFFGDAEQSEVFHDDVLLYVDANLVVRELPLATNIDKVRKLLFGTDEAASH
jgi:hypothetical protein